MIDTPLPSVDRWVARCFAMSTASISTKAGGWRHRRRASRSDRRHPTHAHMPDPVRLGVPICSYAAILGPKIERGTRRSLWAGPNSSSCAGPWQPDAEGAL
jgi:hypothetical protein